MKNFSFKTLVTALFFFLFLTSFQLVLAQNVGGMMGQNFSNIPAEPNLPSTEKDELEGKAIWEKLQSKQTNCKNLTNDDFDVLGDYFMGQMVGSGHPSMNSMMTRMMGEEGEKQMHIAMGKRLSACDSNAALPQEYQNFQPAMDPRYGEYRNFSPVMPMMDSYASYRQDRRMVIGTAGLVGLHIMGVITVLLIWTLLVFAIMALHKYIKRSKQS